MAVIASVRLHQGIRQQFGSKRQGGLPYFGKQAPGLLVFRNGIELPVAVFPHRRTRGRTSVDFSIENFLRTFVLARG